MLLKQKLLWFSFLFCVMKIVSFCVLNHCWWSAFYSLKKYYEDAKVKTVELREKLKQRERDSSHTEEKLKTLLEKSYDAFKGKCDENEELTKKITELKKELKQVMSFREMGFQDDLPFISTLKFSPWPPNPPPFYFFLGVWTFKFHPVCPKWS